MMTSAQKELSTALRNLSDSKGGVVAQVESANNRLTHSLESRAKTVDALLHQLKTDVLCIWIPLVSGAAPLIGLFAGIGIKGCRDASLAAVETPAPTVAQPAASPPDGKSVPDANSVNCTLTGGRQNPALNLGDRLGLHRSLLLYLTRTKGFRKRSRIHSIQAIAGQDT